MKRPREGSINKEKVCRASTLSSIEKETVGYTPSPDGGCCKHVPPLFFNGNVETINNNTIKQATASSPEDDKRAMWANVQLAWGKLCAFLLQQDHHQSSSEKDKTMSIKVEICLSR